MLRLKINNQSQSRAVIVAGELGYYNSRQEHVYLHKHVYPNNNKK